MGPALTDGVGGSSVARCAIGGAPRVGNARRAAAETVVRGFISRAGLFRGQPARPLAAHELNARARTQRDRARHGSIVSGVNGHLASRAAAVGPWPGKASQGAVVATRELSRREFRYLEEDLQALPGQRGSRPVPCARMRAAGRGSPWRRSGSVGRRAAPPLWARARPFPAAAEAAGSTGCSCQYPRSAVLRPRCGRWRA